MQTEIITTQVSIPVQIEDKSSILKKQIIYKLREVSSDPEMFDEFIRFISKFHNYSMYNRILIFIQRRDSSQVAGYRTWQSLNRQVKKGETGILIFAPKMRKIKSDDGNEEDLFLTGFRTVSVFDYNQTAPKEPGSDEIKIPSFGRLIADDPEVIYEKLKNIAMNSGLQVIETNMEFSKAGSTNGKIIKINRLTGSDAKCATIIHEISHVMLNHLDDRKEIPRHTKEVEAELTSFLVGMSIGLPRGNYEYIKSWLRDDVLTDEAIDQAIKTSDKIISLINNVKEPTIN